MNSKLTTEMQIKIPSDVTALSCLQITPLGDGNAFTPEKFRTIQKKSNETNSPRYNLMY